MLDGVQQVLRRGLFHSARACYPGPVRLCLGTIGLLLVASATHGAAPRPLARRFLFGVATSGYQSEGGETNTNWNAWEAAHADTLEPVGRAVDFYDRYRQDIALAAHMGLNAFRFGIEWARVEPQPGEFDAAAIDHYRRVLREVRKRHLEPLVTLNHFTWPQWLEEQARAAGAPSAWEYPPSADAFVSYVRAMVQALGKDIRYYLVFNEPNALLFSGYVFAAYPPGISGDLFAASGQRAFYRAFCTVLAAHAAAYDAIHALDADAQVSSNLALIAFHGAAGDLQDNFAVLPDWANNEFFFDALAGQAAPFKIGETCSQLYADQPLPAAAVSAGAKQDYLSFDYYYSFPQVPDVTTIGTVWVLPIYPTGLLDALRKYHARYPDVPILIPENGIGTENGMPRADGWTREAVLVQHVAEVQAAVAEGIPVLGYFHWSLTDNYEWGSYTPRFGLYRVEARTDPKLIRHPTPAVGVFRQIARHRGVTGGLLRRYPSR